MYKNYKMEIIFAFILFFILTPGILVTFPPKSSKIIVALVHSILFAIILISIHGFKEGNAVKSKNPSYSTIEYTQSFPQYTGYFMSH